MVVLATAVVLVTMLVLVTTIVVDDISGSISLVVVMPVAI